jgi:hypothetical protein
MEHNVNKIWCYFARQSACEVLRADRPQVENQAELLVMPA